MKATKATKPAKPAEPDLFPAERPAAVLSSAVLLDAIIVGRDWPEPTPAMIESVRRIGVFLSVALAAEGPKFRVLDGRRRVKAALAAELTKIPARVYNISGASDAAVATLVTNLHRSANVPEELRAIETLMEKSGATPAQLAHSLGIPLHTVRRRLKLRGLVKDLREAFDKGALGAKAAEKAATLPAPVQAKLAKQLKGGERLTMGAVHEVRQARAAKVAAALPESVFAGPSSGAPTHAVQEYVKAAGQVFAKLTKREQSAVGYTIARAFEAGRQTATAAGGITSGEEYANLTIRTLIAGLTTEAT
jgi:ParB/RepB/Spo0J family partition protein